MLEVTPLYAAIVAFLMAQLSSHVGYMRGKSCVALGDGEKRPLALSIRRFGNLSEYAAMAVLLLLLMELTGTQARWLHAYGIALIALRVLHPLVLFDNLDVPWWKKAGRFLSAAGTATLLAIGGIALLI